MANNQKLNFKQSEGEINILIASTGSVASIKLPLLVEKFQNLHIPRKIPLQTNLIGSDKTENLFKVNVRVVTTEHAKHFFKPETLPVIVYEDEDEWLTWNKRTDPVLHIELRRWANALVIAPLDANTLAKLANGLCDNLLTCVARAWDFSKPLFFAPSMNTYMWEHPFTQKHIACIFKLGCKEIPCVEKTLVCGDKGMGAMAEVDTIVQCVQEYFCKV